jgi:cell division septum initiation protein DivIVA
VGHPAQHDPAVVAAGTEFDVISRAIADLQNRLEGAYEQLGQVTEVRTTEFEIGRLFVEAQRFSEESLSRLERQIQEILVEAEAKAAEILQEATEEALEIRRQSQQSSFIPAHTAQGLQSTIAEFVSVNNGLRRELDTLNLLLMTSTEGEYPYSAVRSN